MMKKINYIFLALSFLVGTFTSCDDMFNVDAKSSLEDSNIFSTPALAEGAITAILHSFGEQNSYRGRLIHYYGSNTDIEWYGSSDNTTDDRAELTGYGVTPTNTRMNTSVDTNPYSKMYEALERSNIAIEGFRQYGDIENNKEIGQLYGEALTLRAFVLYELIKFWGDVPLRLEPVNNETIYLPRTNRDVIFKQLIEDLEEAARHLHWPNETSRTQSVENVNKAFAKGLRARICLAAAGYSQRWDGTIRKGEEMDPDLSIAKLYPIVKNECIDIIESQTLTLRNGFEKHFKDLCQDIVTAGRESIWEIPFAQGRGQVMYGFALKHDNPDEYLYKGMGGMVGPVPTLFYDFDPEDIRRDITCIPYQWESGVQVPNKLSQWFFGKYRYEWMNRYVSSDDDGVNWPIMRLADIYLMAAEAINEIDGPDKAVEYLRPVRERAFPDNSDKVENYLQSITVSKNTFFDAIVDERAFEFCGEFLRKGDLIRWNMLKSKIDESKEKMYQLQNQRATYSDLNEKLYYRYASDGKTVEIYGLEKGELDVKSSTDGWNNKRWLRITKKSGSGNDNIKDEDGNDALFAQPETEKIESIYQRNPDQYQYWPIFQNVLDASNNMLTNQINY